MSQIQKIVKLASKTTFLGSRFFDDFLDCKNTCFFFRFWVPKLKRCSSLFGRFFDNFRVFSSFGCFPRFWLIFLAQGDQKCRKNDEKTSLTTNLFTSSYHQPTHDILFIFPVNGKLKRPFPMNGRAVFPALPAQFLLK